MEPKLRVLESFQQPRATTNPYITQLLAALRERADVDTFSWRRAVRGRYDVFHVHWPEVMLASPTWWKRIARRACFALMLVHLRHQQTAVVRTMHNVAPHDQIGRTDNWLLAKLDAQTTAWIRINERTELPAEQPSTTILHGHYRDWFSAAEQESADGRALAFVGQIRPYKAVDRLIEVFGRLPDPSATLTVLGNPNSPELATQVTALAAADPRVSLTLRHVSDEELAHVVHRSACVVLPYAEMHNSGAALVAISLATRVLVPRTEINDDLAREVGPGWVLRYDGTLTPAALAEALDQPIPTNPPDLSRREWGPAAQAHVALFRDAVAHRRSSSRG